MRPAIEEDGQPPSAVRGFPMTGRALVDHLAVETDVRQILICVNAVTGKSERGGHGSLSKGAEVCMVHTGQPPTSCTADHRQVR